MHGSLCFHAMNQRAPSREATDGDVHGCVLSAVLGCSVASEVGSQRGLRGLQAVCSAVEEDDGRGCILLAEGVCGFDQRGRVVVHSPPGIHAVIGVVAQNSGVWCGLLGGLAGDGFCFLGLCSRRILCRALSGFGLVGGRWPSGQWGWYRIARSAQHRLGRQLSRRSARLNRGALRG